MGLKELDASLLMMPMMGFLPIDGPPGGQHHRSRQAGPDGGRLRAPLPQQLRRRRLAGQTRGRSCLARYGWWPAWPDGPDG